MGLFTKKKKVVPKKKETQPEFPWLNGKKKTLTLEEVTDIEELLEDDDF